MRQLTPFILQLFLTLTVESQSLQGIYHYDGQEIRFKGNRVEYSLNSGGCLITEYIGFGDFKIKNDRLFIHPNFDNKAAPIKPIPSENMDILTIHINSQDSLGVVHAGVGIALYKKGTIIYTTSTDKENKVEIKRNQIIGCDSIILNTVGYFPLKIIIDKDQKLDYVVRFDPGSTIDRHKAFITSNGHGFALKIHKDSFDLMYMEFSDCNQNAVWHTFKKN